MPNPPPPPLPRSLVGSLAGSAGRTVRLCGWAEPADGEPPGLLLRDHSGRVRLEGAVAGGVTPESAIEVVGRVLSDDEGIAVAVDELTVVGPAVAPCPLPDGAPLDQRLDWRFLDLRRRLASRLALEVQTTAERAMRAMWEREGFLEIHSPKLRATANRSGRELFTLDYFGRPAYLAQSPQFPKQMAMAAGLDRVFEVGPVFRANPSVTDRHDTEFTSIDVEMAWISSPEDVMAFEERLLAEAVAAVADRHGEAIEQCFGVRVRVPDVPFPRISLVDAYEILPRLGWTGTTTGDLDRQGERLLAADVAVTTGSDLVFVTGYGAAARPFYHMRDRGDPGVTLGFDLLWRGIEVTTGAQREHRYDVLVGQALDRGIPQAAVQHYLDFFRFGCPPHGGFGLGLTRMLMALLGLDDVREVTYLPRGPDRLAP